VTTCRINAVEIKCILYDCIIYAIVPNAVCSLEISKLFLLFSAMARSPAYEVFPTNSVHLLTLKTKSLHRKPYWAYRFELVFFRVVEEMEVLGKGKLEKI